MPLALEIEFWLTCTNAKCGSRVILQSCKMMVFTNIYNFRTGTCKIIFRTTHWYGFTDVFNGERENRIEKENRKKLTKEINDFSICTSDNAEYMMYTMSLHESFIFVIFYNSKFFYF